MKYLSLIYHLHFDFTIEKIKNIQNLVMKFYIDELLKSFNNERQNPQTLMNYRNLTLVNF